MGSARFVLSDGRWYTTESGLRARGEGSWCQGRSQRVPCSLHPSPIGESACLPWHQPACRMGRMASNHPISLPTEISDLTTDWLDEALQSWNPGVKLERSEIVDINNGTCTKI